MGAEKNHKNRYVSLSKNISIKVSNIINDENNFEVVHKINKYYTF